MCGVWVVGSQLPGPTARFCVSFVEYAVVCAYSAVRFLAHPTCSMCVLVHGGVRGVCGCAGGPRPPCTSHACVCENAMVCVCVCGGGGQVPGRSRVLRVCICA